MTWSSVVPDVLVCIGLFFAPGLLAAYLGGLRGITAWASAPLVTVAAVAAVAVACGLLGFRFGAWPVAAGTVVMAGLSAGLSLLLRSRRVERPPRDTRSYSLAVVIGVIAAAVIGGVTFITGVRRPDAISQSWDSVFHYNAIRYIEQTGKASPLTVGTLGQPGGLTSFYPDAWHTMAALLAELTGTTVPVAAVVTCLVIAVLVWPLSCLLLARHLFGGSGRRAIAAAVVTGMLSNLFGAFPWMLTGAYGILWPNALGMALAPVGIALGLSIMRVSDGDTFGPVRRWVFGVAGAWAIAISHPNSALSVAVICVFPLLAVLGPVVARQFRRHTVGATLVLLAVVAVAIAGGVIVSNLTAIRIIESVSWHPFETPAQAAVSALSNSTDHQTAELLLATFLIIGVVACFIWRKWRWLVCAEVVIVALYVGSAGIGSPAARLFTGLWYDDSYRIAAILPVVAIPLTTIGVLAVGEWLPQIASQAGVAARPALALALPVAVGAVVTTATAAQSVPHNVYTAGLQFNTAGDETLISPSKLQFLQTVARLVPSSALVADNPFEGTAYLFAMSGTRVVFPQMSQSNNLELIYLAQNLVKASQDTRACDLVRRYAVEYMVVAPDNFLKKRNVIQRSFYEGVAQPAANSGFQLIASAAGGQLSLYKITICQPTKALAGSVEANSGTSG